MKFSLFSRNNQSKTEKATAKPRSRRLALEPLESRDLLAVSVAEFNQIRAAYPDLGLSANISDYNVIEITAANLSVANLKSAITEAGTTTKPDLIVARTTAEQNTITYASAADAISININASTWGSVTIVGFGDAPLTIDANGKSRVMSLTSSTVGLGNLTITGGNTSNNGGGISNGGTLTVTNSTVSSNSAGVGGGIFNFGTTNLYNSIVAKNSTDIYCLGTITGSNNLIGDGTDSTLVHGVNGNIVGTSASPIDPGTGELAELLSGQRIPPLLASSMAFAESSSSIIVTNTNDSGAGSLRQAIANAGTSGFGNTITFAASLANQTIKLNGTQIVIDKNITIDGGGKITISAESKSRIFTIYGQYGKTVSLVGLTFTKGLPSDFHSGAIYASYSDLNIKNCKFIGNAASSTTHYAVGGALYGYASHVVINSCEFRDNYARSTVDGAFGGAIYMSRNSTTNEGCSLAIFDTTFTNNRATSTVGAAYGGAVNSRATFTRCTFTNNYASTTSAGGSKLPNGNPLDYNGNANGGACQGGGTFLDCEFSGNYAQATKTAAQGGAIYGSATLTNTRFYNNRVSGGVKDARGGGIYGSGITINSCVFEGNTADYGGGIFTTDTGTAKISNSQIVGNYATGNGGGILSYGDFFIASSIIVGNYAGEAGGGISNGGNLTLTNVTLAGNSAGNYAGGINSIKGVTIQNSMIARNMASNVEDNLWTSNDSKAFTNVSDSLISNTTPRNNSKAFTNNGNNIQNVDPRFIKYTSYTTWTKDLWKAWDLRLITGSTGSPAIDKGDNDAAFDSSTGRQLRLDLDGKQRIIDGKVDMGAYESGIGKQPATPENLAVPYTEITSSSLQLKWECVTTDVTGYELRYRALGTVDWKTRDLTVTETYDKLCTLSGLSVATTYDIQIRAVNGALVSTWAGRTITTATLSTLKPAVPGYFSVKKDGITKNSITLTWAYQAGLSGYRLEYKKSTQSDAFWTDTYARLGSPGGSAQQFTITGLDAGTNYDFRLVAKRDANAAGFRESNAATLSKIATVGTGQNYAVLFAGGGNAANNHIRYYNAIRDLYNVLITSYGLSRENIYVIYADGTADGIPDRSDGKNSDMTFANGSSVMSATLDNLRNTFSTLDLKMTSNDHLLFYTYDHGGGTTAETPAKKYDTSKSSVVAGITNEETLVGWGRNIEDEDVAASVERIQQGYVTLVFAQCFAGGILDNIIDPATGKKLISTNAHLYGMAATNHYEYSWGDGFARAFINGIDPTKNNTSTTQAFAYAQKNNQYTASGNYTKNTGTLTDNKEHPWEAGETFSIFVSASSNTYQSNFIQMDGWNDSLIITTNATAKTDTLELVKDHSPYINFAYSNPLQSPVSGTVTVTGGSLTKPTTIDVTGAMLTQDEDGGGQLATNLYLGALGSGVYTVCVELLVNGEYTVMEREFSVVASSIDVGDTLAGAQLITRDEGETPIEEGVSKGEFDLHGILGDGSYGGKDVDFFRYDVREEEIGKTLVFSTIVDAFSTMPADTYIRLFNAAGVALASSIFAINDGMSSLSYIVMAAGAYYIGVSALDNTQYNPNTANIGIEGNVGHYQLSGRVSETQPDLSMYYDYSWIDNITVATSPTATISENHLTTADTIFVNYKFQNAGFMTAGAVTNRITITGPNGYSKSQDFTSTPLPVGEFQQLSQNFSWGKLAVGEYTITAILDVTGVQSELSETNNTVSWQFLVSPSNTLSAPANLRLSNPTSSSVSVSWSSVANATGYTIQYSTSSTFATGNQTQTVVAGVTSFTLTGLATDTTYYVRIVAKGDSGATVHDSDYSQVRIATTYAVPVGLVVQTVLRDTIITDNSVPYEKAAASRITTLNEWSHFSIDVWVNAGSCGNILSFSATTLQFNPAFFVVSNVVFGEGFSGTFDTTVSGQVTISSASASVLQDGRVFLFRVEFKPADEPYNWTGITSVSSNLGFTTDTISIQSQALGGSAISTMQGIAVPNPNVVPVPYDFNGDRKINASDFLAFAKSYGQQNVGGTGSAIYDFNDDGKVNAADFLMFAKAYGKSSVTGLSSSLLPKTGVSQSLAAEQCSASFETETETDSLAASTPYRVSESEDAPNDFTRLSYSYVVSAPEWDGLETIERTFAEREVLGLTGRGEEPTSVVPDVFEHFEESDWWGEINGRTEMEETDWWGGKSLRADLLETVLAELGV